MMIVCKPLYLLHNLNNLLNLALQLLYTIYFSFTLSLSLLSLSHSTTTERNLLYANFEYWEEEEEEKKRR